MAAKIPLVVTQDRTQNLYQTQLGKSLTPILQCPVSYGLVIQSITIDNSNNRVQSNFLNLVSGANIIQHQLGRKPQGYFIVRQKSAASIYDTWDTQNIDSQPLETVVTFNSSANVTVSIWIF